MNQQPGLKMTERPTIPEAYIDVLLETLRADFNRLTWIMRGNYGLYNLPMLTNDDLFFTPFATTLASIARAAAGQRTHDEIEDAVLAEEIQSVFESLFSAPATYSYVVPDAFWETGLGIMIARAQLWLHGDELVTIADAAKRFGKTVQAVSQAMNDGRLRSYHDPDARQRQGARLISLSEASSLWGS